MTNQIITGDKLKPPETKGAPLDAQTMTN